MKVKCSQVKWPKSAFRLLRGFFVFGTGAIGHWITAGATVHLLDACGRRRLRRLRRRRFHQMKTVVTAEGSHPHRASILGQEGRVQRRFVETVAAFGAVIVRIRIRIRNRIRIASVRTGIRGSAIRAAIRSRFRVSVPILHPMAIFFFHGVVLLLLTAIQLNPFIRLLFIALFLILFYN